MELSWKADQAQPTASVVKLLIALDLIDRSGVPTGDELEGYFSTITEMVLDHARQSGIEMTAAEAHAQAVALFCQLVGAMVVSRAVAEADPGLSDEILTINRKQLRNR
ncbi:hypothetical protein JOF56_008407 [Kibdelosporangium banguiense]|uniref:Uncharacterized protein n=1 Tax=Kibdelosporangium banguiense TaxID=1365924 RepID=A0ABS4TUF8_9PSEU|nr:hypothetical protein [Kibdelosporangium banguiense]MBP2328022.1 hypothetical protein [Kibdelosporangium banguiense]